MIENLLPTLSLVYLDVKHLLPVTNVILLTKEISPLAGRNVTALLVDYLSHVEIPPEIYMATKG